MTYRPVKEQPELTPGQKRRRAMQDKRDNRYGKSKVIHPKVAADTGLPTRKSIPADVVTTK